MKLNQPQKFIIYQQVLDQIPIDLCCYLQGTSQPPPLRQEGGGIGPPLSFEKKILVIKGTFSYFVAWLKLYIIKSFKIAEEECLAIYKNVTVDSVTS